MLDRVAPQPTPAPRGQAVLAFVRPITIRAALVLAVGTFIAPAVLHAVAVWSLDEEFTYGFLIPPMAVLLLWWRRAEARRRVSHGSRVGLAIVLLSVVVTLVSRRIGINVLAGLAISPLLWGVAVYLWGWGTGRVLAFPLGFLVFGFGLYRGLLNSVGFALQNITAVNSAWSAQLLGLDVMRDGLVLQAPTFAFIVAQTCSGMSSLLSLLALAALWMYATRGRLRGRAVVLLSVLPLVVVANTVRVTLVLVVANWFGQDVALGFFHGASSLVLFGIALSGLLVVSRMVGCRVANLATQY